ncbi:MAG: hypothetical protein AB4290_28460, partial [Spirulina sp.]
GLSDTDIKNQLDKERLEGEKERIQAELALEEEKIKELENLQTGTGDQAEEKEQEIREAKRKTLELQAELIENQLALEENARAIIIEQIRKEYLILKENIEDAIRLKHEEVQANELLNQSLNRQKALLNSKSALLRAQSQLVQTQSQIEIDGLNRALQIRQQLASSDAQTAQALRQELASLGISSGQSELSLIQQKQAAEKELFEQKQAQISAELEQKQIALELETQQNELQQESLLLQAEEAQLQAQLNKLKAEEALEIAETEGVKEGIRLAQRKLEIANKELEFSQKKIENAKAENATQTEVLQQKKQQLEVEKQIARAREEANRRALKNKQNLERATAKAGKGSSGGSGISGSGSGVSGGGTTYLLRVGSKEHRAYKEASKFVDNARKAGRSDEDIAAVAGRIFSGNKEAFISQLLNKDTKLAALKNSPFGGRDVFPKLDVGAGFNDKNMVNELQGLRNDFKSLAGVMANRSSSVSVTNNYPSRSSNYGKLATGSVGI